MSFRTQSDLFFHSANPFALTLQNYNAKLSDFGLARDGPTGDKSHVSTRVLGTYGYAAPEYLATGILSNFSVCLFFKIFDYSNSGSFPYAFAC